MKGGMNEGKNGGFKETKRNEKRNKEGRNGRKKEAYIFV